MGDASRAVSTHLLDILLRQQRLGGHLAALRRYVLLAQGDYVRALLDSAAGELDRPAREASQYALQVGGGGAGLRPSACAAERAARQPPTQGVRAGPAPAPANYHRPPTHPPTPLTHLPTPPTSYPPTPPNSHPPTTTPTPTALQGHLDSALRGCCRGGEDGEAQRRLDVRLARAMEGDRGWDVFALSYRVEGPLAAVLSPEAMAGGWVGG